MASPVPIGTLIAPTGLPGIGSPGLPSWTHIASEFTPPAVGGTVQIAVDDTGWMAPGAPLYIGGGTYQIETVDSASQATLIRLQGQPGAGSTFQVGPGLQLDEATDPPTLDVATPYLPLSGGELSGPGDLTVGGILTAGNGILEMAAVGQIVGVAGAINLQRATGTNLSSIGLFADNVQVTGILGVTGNITTSGSVTAGNGNINMGTAATIGASGTACNITNQSDGNLINIGLFANNVTVNGTLGATGITSSGNVTAGVNLFAAGGFFGASTGTNTTIISNNGIQYAGASIGGAQVIAFMLSGGNPFLYANGGQQGWWPLTVSDTRLKRSIQPIERDCLATINAIELRQFDMETGDENEPSRHFDVGYLAQQVREVMPDAVPDAPGDGSLGVDYRSLCAHLIGAVQQLSAIVEGLAR